MLHKLAAVALLLMHFAASQEIWEVADNFKVLLGDEARWDAVQGESGSGAAPMRSRVKEADMSDRNSEQSACGMRKSGRRLVDEAQDGFSLAKNDRKLLSHKKGQCLCDWCDENCPLQQPACKERKEPWCCGDPIEVCGYSMDENWRCVCDLDQGGNLVCWQDDFCMHRQVCTRPSDCLPDEVCVSTCCDGQSKERHRCFKKCEMPFQVEEPDPCDNVCMDVVRDWSCGVSLDPFLCGKADDPRTWRCVCDYDCSGNKFCWQDNWCSALTTCYSNANCEDNERCIPNTCCGVKKCIQECDNPEMPA